MTEHVSNERDAPGRLARPDGHTIAYRAAPGKRPGVVFVGGFSSDMSGTKATALDGFCRADGRAYARFDYLGHGASSGAFVDGTIGRWAADTIAVIDAATEGPQVLVGSSMGGWLMVLAALARPERVCGLVGVAAAPDFTEDLWREAFDDAQREALMRDGVVEQPSDHGDDPTPITRALIEDGREHLLMGAPIPLSCPVRLIHGMADADVPWRTSLALAEKLASDDVEVTLIKDGGHRLSDPAALARLWRAVAEVCRLASQPPPARMARRPASKSG